MRVVLAHNNNINNHRKNNNAIFEPVHYYYIMTATNQTIVKFDNTMAAIDKLGFPATNHISIEFIIGDFTGGRR